MELLRDRMGDRRALARADLRDLVSDRVQDDARVVVVLAHHGGHILFPPVCKVEAVVVVRLAAVPHVGELVHDIEAHRITGPKPGRGSRLMGHAHRIEPGRLQSPHLSKGLIPVHGSAQNPAVVVDAGAAELHTPSIDAKTSNGIERERPDAKGGLLAIEQSLSRKELGLCLVQDG